MSDNAYTERMSAFYDAAFPEHQVKLRGREAFQDEMRAGGSASEIDGALEQMQVLRKQRASLLASLRDQVPDAHVMYDFCCSCSTNYAGRAAFQY